MLAGLTFPIFLAIVPLFFVLRGIGLLNTLPGLILTYAAFAFPFTVFFLFAFFRSLSTSIAEAAAIDGAGEWRTFFQIMLPMARPGLATVVPVGATVLDPVGTAPGLVVPPSSGAGPTIVVLPGPPRELQPMWAGGRGGDAFRAAIRGAVDIETAMLRLFGIPESEIAETLRRARVGGVDIDALEITTCLRRGEIEVVTRYEPGQAAVYAAFEELVRERHARHAVLRRRHVGRPAGGRAAARARLDDRDGGVVHRRAAGGAGSRTRPGASDYFTGGVVVYDRAAKEELGVAPATLDAHGEVSVETARELAAGARSRRGTEVGVGVTGIAGPGGGTPEKPVGLVCFSVAGPDGSLTRSATLPGGRFDVRDRSTTVAHASRPPAAAGRARLSRAAVRRPRPAGGRARGARRVGGVGGRRDERLRLVREESLHATLVFLGERPDPRLSPRRSPSPWRRRCPRRRLRLDGAAVAVAAPAARADGRAGGSRRRPGAHPGAVLDALVREAGLDAEARRFSPARHGRAGARAAAAVRAARAACAGVPSAAP